MELGWWWWWWWGGSATTSSSPPPAAAASPARALFSPSPKRTPLFARKYSIIPDLMSTRRDKKGKRMSNQSDTNSYEPAWIPPRGQSLGTAAVRPPHGCVRLTNVDGFRFEKVEGGGRDREGRAVVVERGEGGSPRQSVSYRQSGGSEQSGAGGCLRDGLGDVVRGYPRPGSHGGEPGRGADCRYRHATRFPAAQGGNGRSRPKSVTVR